MDEWFIHAGILETASFIYVLVSHAQFCDQFLNLFEPAVKGDLITLDQPADTTLQRCLFIQRCRLWHVGDAETVLISGKVYRLSDEVCRLSAFAVFQTVCNAKLRPMKTRESGFSLIELMVTVAIVVILAVLAMPSFQTLLLGRQIEAAADTLASDFRFARSEAVKRTNRVTICTSSNGTSCTGAGGLWIEGWIVFVDEDGDGAVDADDVVVRVQDAMTGILSIAAADGTSRSHFVFQSSGWSQSASQTFLVKPIGSSGVAARLLCISNKGRPGIRAKGETTCA